MARVKASLAQPETAWCGAQTRLPSGRRPPRRLTPARKSRKLIL